jgi:hypothetical protein
MYCCVFCILQFFHLSYDASNTIYFLTNPNNPHSGRMTASSVGGEASGGSSITTFKVGLYGTYL